MLMTIAWCLCHFSIIILFFKFITSKCVYKANPTYLGLRFIAYLAELSKFAYFEMCFLSELRSAIRKSTLLEKIAAVCVLLINLKKHFNQN